VDRPRALSGPRALLLVGVLVAALMLPGSAAAGPVTYGKVVAPGVTGVPYASTTTATLPSWPSSPGYLGDGDLVYDTTLQIWIVNANSFPVSLSVVTEIYNWGTQTVLINETSPSGGYVFVPVQEPVRVNVIWTNATVSALPDEEGGTTIALPFSASEMSLAVTVGTAGWALHVLTPATSSAAGIATTGGEWIFGTTESGITAAVLLGALLASRRFAKRVLRTPRVPLWWPVVWIGSPIVAFVIAYVPTNQLLGPVSPFVVPVPIGFAAFPYLPRLWRNYKWSRFQGVEGKNLELASSAEVVLPLTTTSAGIACAPETWREVLYVALFGAPLPPVIGRSVDLLGTKVTVQPRGMDVSNPLRGYYRSEADAAYWFDTHEPLERRRHEVRWTRTVTVEKETVLPDGSKKRDAVKKRRFSPHIELGYFSGTFPPLKPVAEVLANVRSAEVEAHDNEVDRLENAELRGRMRHWGREMARRSVRVVEESYDDENADPTAEEVRRTVDSQRRRSSTEHGPESPG